MGSVARDFASRERPDVDARRLAIVEALAQHLCVQDDPRALCSFVYAQLTQELIVDAFSMALAHGETGHLHPVLVIEHGVEQPSALSIAPHERPDAPRLVDDARGDRGEPERARPSSLICTMRSGGRLVGRIVITARMPGAYRPEDARFLRTISDLLAGAFERQLLLREAGTPAVPGTVPAAGPVPPALAALSERIGRAADDPDAVLRLICEEATALLGMSRACIYVLDAAQARLMLQVASPEEGMPPLGTGLALDDPLSLAARATRDRRVIVEDTLTRAGASASADAAQPPDCPGALRAVAAPLRQHGISLGALVLTDQRGRILRPADLRLVSALADQAASGVAWVQIRAMERERRRVAEALAAISAGIDSGASPDTLYGLILRHAALLLSFDEAAITLLESGVPTAAASMGSALVNALSGIDNPSFWYAAANLELVACTREPRLKDLCAEIGFQDLLSMPLMVNRAIVGRLTFASRRSDRLGTHEAQLAALLAERAAQVVRTARLHAAHESAVARIIKLDTLREHFVATVSHELRTPLTGILGYLELLISRWDTLPDERRRGMLERTQSSAARLEHLVTDLLLFSNVEHQELRLQIADQPLAALVERAVDGIAMRFRNPDVAVRPAAHPVSVRVDAQRTVQVLVNLLDNAVKYSPPGAPIQVRWTAHRHTVEITVRDRGPGIAAEDLPRLFTRFGTLGHHPHSGQAGAGIGLYLCRKLLQAMGGQIWATSRLGHGTTFRLTLPRGRG